MVHKKKIYSFDDLRNPIGNNNTSSLGIFYWRDIYKSHVAPEDGIEMWYKNVHYGRVNANGEPIYPLESALIQLKTSKSTVFAVNFVAGAWQGFKNFIATAVRSGDLNTNGSIYSALDPHTGWKSVTSLYHEMNFGMYEVFAEEFMTSPREQKIINFKGFVEVYTEFVNSMAHLYPITREGMMLSRYCPPHISGLIIEIANVPYDVDRVKARFLNDKNFNYIKEAARRFGFKIDKNAPWRFVADLESEEMIEYMRNYTGQSSAHDIMYIKSNEYELNFFKEYIWRWYNQFTEERPTSDKVIASRCNKSTFFELVEREKVSREELFGRYSDDYWIRLYIFVRAKEARVNWTQIKFNSVVKKVIDYKRAGVESTGMLYLHKELNKKQKKHFHEENRLTKKEVNARIRKRNANRHYGSFNY